MLINSVNYNFANTARTQDNALSFKSKFSNGMMKPKHIKPYVANRFFAGYNPVVKNFNSYKIPVHNEEIGKYLKSSYSAGEFRKLFEFSKQKGTFDYIMNDKTGFIKTSFINRKENVLMSDLVWITDTCNNLELVKSQKPQDCTRVLEKMAELYEGQKSEFDTVIKTPSKYMKSGFWVWQGQTGSGHCFDPKTHKPHQWFAKTRLESVGNYLQQSTDIITKGFSGGKYGYKTAEEIPDTVIDSVVNCTKYLKAIHYPTARSCGAWEEQTFAGSLTSDTAVCNQGIRNILKLMYKPSENPEMIRLREQIKSSKHGDVFNNKSELEQLLKDGEDRISAQPDIEVLAPHPKRIKPKDIKYYERYYDSAMAFVPQTEKIDKNDIYRDSAKKLYLLKKLEKNLVRDNGSIRYKGDNYLNIDYHTHKKHTDSDKINNEAQWFLVSEISCGYGAVVKQLLENIKTKGEINNKDKKLLNIALKGETEHINRSYARITSKKSVKSNGYTCPAYKVPEAYEAVTTNNGKVKYLPGAHTLTWAEASLHKASEMFLQNLETLKELNL